MDSAFLNEKAEQKRSSLSINQIKSAIYILEGRTTLSKSQAKVVLNKVLQCSTKK